MNNVLLNSGLQFKIKWANVCNTISIVKCVSHYYKIRRDNFFPVAIELTFHDEIDALINVPLQNEISVIFVRGNRVSIMTVYTVTLAWRI